VSLVFTVRDTGVGITAESRKQIFSGFYHARDTGHYSTKKPFDFGAGGKGLELLRIRELSEDHAFRLASESRRCAYTHNPFPPARSCPFADTGFLCHTDWIA
jgi:signal transduction histidine kinase